jgi:hypothetical protein
MPSHDILGNDALVAPAALARAIVPLLVSYTGRDRRFVQEMQDQSIKRGSSAKELGDRRDAANCSKWPPWGGQRQFPICPTGDADDLKPPNHSPAPCLDGSSSAASGKTSPNPQV